MAASMDDERRRIRWAEVVRLLRWSNLFTLLDHEFKMVPISKVFGNAYFQRAVAGPLFLIWEGGFIWWFYGTGKSGVRNASSVSFDSLAGGILALAGVFFVLAWVLLPLLKLIDIRKSFGYGRCPACGYVLAGLKRQGFDRVVCAECGGVWRVGRTELTYRPAGRGEGRWPIWYRKIVLPIFLGGILTGSALVSGGDPIAAVVLVGLPLAVLVMMS